MWDFQNWCGTNPCLLWTFHLGHSSSSFCTLVTVFLLESSLPFAFDDFIGMHANDRKFKKGVKYTRNPCRRTLRNVCVLIRTSYSKFLNQFCSTPCGTSLSTTSRPQAQLEEWNMVHVNFPYVQLSRAPTQVVSPWLLSHLFTLIW